MEPDEFDAALDDFDRALETPQAPTGAPAPEAPIGPKPEMEPGLSDPTSFLDAAMGGAAQAVMETKDFIFGEPEQKSDLRENIETKTKKLGEESVVDGLVANVTQFATGMLGAGKLTSFLKIAGWGAKAKTAAEVAKAASVGAIAFDPHAERLSNIVESFPAISNPVSRYLAADPTDSAAEGRMKAALESIGFDFALIGTFAASAKLLKAIKGGDEKAIAEAVEETTKAVEVPEPAAAVEAPAKPAVDFTPPPAANDEVGNLALAANDSEIPIRGGNAVPDGKALKLETPQAPTGAANDEVFTGPAPANSNGGWTNPDKGTPLPEVQTNAPAPEAQRVTEWTGKQDPAAPPAAANDAGPAPAASTPEATPKAAPVEVSQVQSPTQGAGGKLPPKAALGEVSDEQLGTILEGVRKDTAALASSGSWDGAIAAGHTFGKGGSIPWQKLPGDDPVDAFISRVAETLKTDLDKAKGGDVLSDAKVQRMVKQRANLWGEDPSALLGLLQGAGKNANTMAANMEAGFLVAQRAMQDAYTLAARINAGYLDEFGGDKAAADAALKQVVSVASTAWGHSQSMRAAAGRSLRRLRGEFKLNEADVAALQGMDGSQLAKLLAATEGDPRAISKVVSPSLWSRGADMAQYLYVNNLLWGLKTHFVNLLTNTYMVAGRPMERAMGSYWVGGASGKSIRDEATKQYAYMGSSLYESFRAAVETWKLGDSVIAPHGHEAHAVGSSIGTAVARMEFKPWTSVPNILHNALLVGVPKTVGAPTRALGAVDEMVKQVVYRSKVQAQAHVEGVAAGLEGKDLTDFVKNRLADAFDDAGRAVDLGAMREAQVATFQQDLLPGTLGKTIQVGVNNHAWTKFILPFVKTPTNVIRMGIKMTPGLNMLQNEYRQMIRGAMGPEAQAQAVGQMAVGSLFLSTAAWLSSQGFITGGGPSDPRLSQTLRATGWQPYSFVIPGEDGTKTYVPYGRFDPVSMPFGMVADLVDVLNAEAKEDQSKVEAMGLALLMGISKQLSNKTYLMSITQTMDAIMDPDRSMARVAGQTVSNFVPMASALRFANPDPYMRESRTLMDSVLKTIPGFSEDLPARRDVWGDPITVNKGLWVDGDRDMVDAEVRRMITEAGVSMGPPGSSVNGVDLRDVTMTDGRNAYEVYQELSGKPTPRSRSLKDTVAMQMKTSAYAKAPDGDSATKGTKLWMIQGSIKKYREAALKRVRADKNVREALTKRDQEVRSAYAAKKGGTATTPQQQQLQAVGRSFGVDLNGLLQ